MTITLYDIPSKSGEAWSLNTWKIRYVLNYKRISYTTEWIEYPDIEAVCVSHGIPPTQTFPPERGRPPLYTLPAIHDPSTGVYTANSFDIVEYLESTYPSAPSVFPGQTRGLQRAFTNGFDRILESHSNSVIPLVAPKLTERSEEYFTRTRKEWYKVASLDDLVPKADEALKTWAKLEVEFRKVDKWYLNKVGEGKGDFVMGDVLSWADIVIASELIWIKFGFGQESAQWKDIEKWNEGRWKNALSVMKEYSQIL